MPSLSTTFSSVDEFSPLQPIIPNLSTSEEMSVLIARIAELNRANTVESSIACSADLFGQDGNGSDDVSPVGDEDGQKKEEREKPTNEATAADQFSKLFEKISELEKQQKQQQNENTTKAISNQFSKMQNDQKILLEKISELEKEQKQLQKENIGKNDQKKLLEKISGLEKQQKEQSKAYPDYFSIIFEKISEMEKNENTSKSTAIQSDQLSKIFEKISELEKQQKEQAKVTSDQFSKKQNDQKILLEKISELEKEQQKQKRKAFLNFRQNYWDVYDCDENLEIIGNKNLIVHFFGHSSDWCFVFAKHPILLNNNSSDIFYYEISVKNKKYCTFFGFAVKRQNKLDGTIRNEKGTYAYDNFGDIWINGERKRINDKYSYGSGDTVGIGVNSSNWQIIFTKNGLRLDSSNFFVDPSFAAYSFHPFVTLPTSGDKIEANFGPKFKFDLSTL